MAFWCTTTLKDRIPAERLIVPYDPKRVKHSAYELGVGREAFITSDSKKSRVKTRVPPGEKIAIPPGQFGLLTTREVVTVPTDTIAFISIRAGVKFRGLVNVSGFHVDPGYNGYLTFAVYNAGSQRVVLDQKEPVFMIWFSELDDVDENPYENKKRGRYIIDSERVKKIQGDVASPAELKKRIDNLQHQVTTYTLLAGIIISGFLIRFAYDAYQGLTKSSAVVPAAHAPAAQPPPDPAAMLMPQPQPDAVAVPATVEPPPEPASQPPVPEARKEEQKQEAPKAEPKAADAPKGAGVD